MNVTHTSALNFGSERFVVSYTFPLCLSRSAPPQLLSFCCTRLASHIATSLLLFFLLLLLAFQSCICNTKSINQSK